MEESTRRGESEEHEKKFEINLAGFGEGKNFTRDDLLSHFYTAKSKTLGYFVIPVNSNSTTKNSAEIIIAYPATCIHV